MRRCVYILSLLLIFFISLSPVKDTDFGWHYRCGKQIFTEKKLCLTNEFSYFLPNYHAYNPSFIYDILISFIYDRFGKFVGLSVFGALLMTIGAAFFIGLFPSINYFMKAMAFLIIYFLSQGVLELGIRSQILSFVFFIMVLAIIDQFSRNNRPLFKILPLIFLIWVNTHSGFFIGLVLLGLYVIQTLIDQKNRFTVMIIFLCSFVATLINPFGYKVYWELYRHLTSPLNQMIAEWVSPNLLMQALMLITTAAVVIGLKPNKRQKTFPILIIGLCLIMSLAARRNIPLFWVAAFYGLFQVPPLHQLFSQRKNTHLQSIFIGILISFHLIVLLAIVPQALAFNTDWKQYCQSGLYRYPCQTLTQYPHLKGNVFAMYEWGGFLIWQKPEVKVFSDGRMPAWKDEQGKSPYQVWLEILQNQPGWNETLNRLKTNYIFINQGVFMDLLLKKGAEKYGWKEEYRKEGVVIYKNLKISF